MELEQRYNAGERIPARELITPEGLELVENVVHYLWQNDKSTKQLDMWGEVHHQRVYPLKDHGK